MENQENCLNFKTGVKDGLPIGLGYLSVSFAFGVKASILLFPIIVSVLMSATNLTSAGQAAGLDIIYVGGAIIELVITQILINSRYFLMSLTLSQKVDDSFTTAKRLFCSAFITDEIFAVAVSKPSQINTNYFMGLSLLPYIGWTVGTLIGAVAGNVLPPIVINSLGIALYAMFIAIILPPATKELGIFIAVILGTAISCALFFLPIFSFLSNGLLIIVSALISATVCALIFPHKEKEAENE